MTADTRRAQPTPAASATFAVDDLVRFCNKRDTAYFGMTGRIATLGNGGATVRLTTRKQVRGCLLSELEPVPVERGGR